MLNELEEINIETIGRLSWYERSRVKKTRMEWMNRQRKQDRVEMKKIKAKIYNLRFKFLKLSSRVLFPCSNYFDYVHIVHNGFISQIICGKIKYKYDENGIVDTTINQRKMNNLPLKGTKVQ